MDKLLRVSKKPTRSSSIELLRLLSLFGIILCHTLSAGKTLAGFNKYFCLMANSGIHAGVGVICFMLITGYFGAHFSLKRLNKTYSIIYICPLVSVFYSIINEEFSALNFLKAFIPITSGKWWYASCYIFTMLLSPFLDELAEKIDKKRFQQLLGALISLFYIVPTFLYFDINNDKGKGIANMIIMYLLGRYLKLYPIKLQKKTLAIIMLSSMLLAFAGNTFVTLVTKSIHWPFSRDCALTTLVSAASLFLLTLELHFSSKAINFIAKNAFYIYLLGFIPVYFKELFAIEKFESSIFYAPVCIGFVFFAMTVSFLVSLILQYPADWLNKLIAVIEKNVFILINKVKIKLKSKHPNFEGDNINV